MPAVHSSLVISGVTGPTLPSSRQLML